MRYAIGGTRMSDIEVRELEQAEYKLWDDLVENSPTGTIFHTSGWLVICRDVLKKDLKIFGCFQKDELIGGCSLLITKVAGIFKVATSTCEMTPYGGVVLKDPPGTNVRKQVEKSHKIMNCLIEFLRKQKFDSINIRFSPDFFDIRPFIWNGWNCKILYTYYFNLEGDISEKISKDVRWVIKKGIENKLIIDSSNDVSLFYDLFEMTFQRQNLKPPVTKVFFEQTMERLCSKQNGEMWIAKMPGGEVAAAEIFIFDNKRAYRWAAASDTNLKNTGATTTLLYEKFQDLKGKFKEIDLMAANTPQLTKFISSFNPELVPYYSINWNNNRFGIFMKVYDFAKSFRVFWKAV